MWRTMQNYLASFLTMLPQELLSVNLDFIVSGTVAINEAPAVTAAVQLAGSGPAS